MFEAMRLLVEAIFPTFESRNKWEERRMNEFLSQATSRSHLESLEREWFNKHHRML